MSSSPPVVVSDPSEFGGDPDVAALQAANWLHSKPGTGVVLLHAKKAVNNNSRFKQAVAGIRVEGVRTIANAGWRGGPMLAAWPSNEVLAEARSLSDLTTALGVLLSPSTNGEIKTWLRSVGAVSLATNELWGSEAMGHNLDPVVVVAMADVSSCVNHANALVTNSDKAVVIETLLLLRQRGYSWDTEALCGWAAGNGFDPREIKNLRRYSDQILGGTQPRVSESAGIGPANLSRWIAEAET